ncbi:MAG: Crp/Fnr family transcriptional regulator [Actinomycetota bacterium]
MKNISLLKNCDLFKNINETDLSHIRYEVKNFSPGETILSEYDKPNCLGLILEGKAEIQKVLPSGKTILIKELDRFKTFGEATLFSNSKSFPVKVLSKKRTRVLFIKKQEMVKLFSLNKEVMENFLEIISNRIIMLKSRLELISESSIRKRISSYLLNNAEIKDDTFHLPFSKAKWANILSIPRPSLSRELKRMQEDGLLSYNRGKITIKDIAKLESLLFE